MTIQMNNVCKRFGQTQALDNVSLRFGEQKIYGLLGNNGAGKTTLFNIITNRYFADSGTVTLDGQDISDNERALSQIYMLSEKNYYPEDMNVKDALRWAARFYPGFDKAFAAELANRFGLPLKKRINALSTGYETLFKIVVALSTNAPFLLLDEPVLGLDAVHRDMFYRLLIQQFERRPACYVISTHLIEEVTGLIEDVIIIREGEILLHESTEELLSRGYTVSGPVAAVDEFINGRTCIGEDQLGGLKSAYLLEPVSSANVPEGLVVSKLNLQQLFVQLTKE